MRFDEQNTVHSLEELYARGKLIPDDFIKNLYLGVASPAEQRLALELIVKAGPVMAVVMADGCSPTIHKIINSYAREQLGDLKTQLIQERGQAN